MQTSTDLTILRFIPLGMFVNNIRQDSLAGRKALTSKVMQTINPLITQPFEVLTVHINELCLFWVK